ncbi:MAG TPA: universal stress protein, partial [Streptomyces sp.]
MTKHVVVGIDGSPESMAAARWAGREAAVRGVGVRLLNVWQAPVGSVQFAPDPEQLRFWEEDRLRDAAKQLKERHPSLAVTMEQVSGTPMQVLLESAATSEMVVLGSHGLGGVPGFLYGSAGLHVLARSD